MDSSPQLLLELLSCISKKGILKKEISFEYQKFNELIKNNKEDPFLKQYLLTDSTKENLEIIYVELFKKILNHVKNKRFSYITPYAQEFSKREINLLLASLENDSFENIIKNISLNLEEKIIKRFSKEPKKFFPNWISFKRKSKIFLISVTALAMLNDTALAEGKTYLTAVGWSKHFDTPKDLETGEEKEGVEFNEGFDNITLGVKYDFGKEKNNWELSGGVTKDSFKSWSPYLQATYFPLKGYTINSTNVNLGVSGFVTYKVVNSFKDREVQGGPAPNLKISFGGKEADLFHIELIPILTDSPILMGKGSIKF